MRVYSARPGLAQGLLPDCIRAKGDESAGTFPEMSLLGAAGEKVTVVAIGGSVTTGMGAWNLSDAYPYRIAAWLETLGTEERPAQIEVCR